MANPAWDFYTKHLSRWALIKEAFGKGEGQANILLSHTHWDHIMGFPFFVPAYIPGNQFTIWGAHKNLRQRFKLQHHPYNFPISMDVMASDIQFKKLPVGQKKHLGKVTIQPFQLEHPGDSYAYRIEYGSKSFVYATDGSYNNPSPDAMAKYYAFYKDADALVFDAHFDLTESFTKSDWGHSTSFIGVDIALNANVKKLILFHHDPLSDDQRLQKHLNSTHRYLNHVAPNIDLEVLTAHEGLELTL